MSSHRAGTAHRVLLVVAIACSSVSCSRRDHEPPTPPRASDRERAAAELANLLLDTDRYELRATLAMKIRNPDRLDESPLRDSILPPGPPPGAHQFDGTVFADLETLQKMLPRGPRVRVEGEAVFVGDPEVLIQGHRHGDALFVPVKLLARQFGAYTDVTGTLATMAIVWTPEILRFMRREGPPGSTGLLEAHAEGLIDSVDVRARPGW